MALSSSGEKPASEFFMEWIPTNEFTLPSATIQTTFKTRLLSFFKPGRETDNMDDALRPKSLESLSADRLNHLAPGENWKSQALSLDLKLMPWCASPWKNFILVLNIPYSGNRDVLQYWAAKHEYQIIEPPAFSSLLDPDDSWFSQFENAGAIWVLPELEGCWLRHEAGLALIRKFFRRLFAGRLGYGVLGCGSWAWAFFRHTLGVSAPISITSKPFDAEKLRQWLGVMAFEKNQRQIQFRQADNGSTVLSYARENQNSGDLKSEQSPFLRDLAAFCYGIPGVAMAYWRASLQAEPDAFAPENRDKAAAGSSTVWIKPWMNVEKPGLPGETRRHHAFILHNLLLHGMLDTDTLSTLLPVSHHIFDQSLYDLSDNGLIIFSENRWRVSPKGYPVVRGFLKTEGFLSDDFR